MFKQDLKGFFLIFAHDGRIIVEHHLNDYKIQERMEGQTAEELCHLIDEKKIISELSHALYLGRELMKAEICLKENKDYEQDVPYS